MNLRKKIWVIAVLICSCTFLSCRQNEQRSQNGTYNVMEVSLSDAVIYNQFSASIEGVQHVEIRPQVSGVITEICFNEGASLHKGQILFIIDQVPYQAALATAVANVESAESVLATAQLTVDSKQALYEGNVISEYELQTARNTLSEAKAALAQARANEMNARNNLSYTVIKSQVNGVASMIPYKVGALVSSSISDPLVTVSSIDEMYAYFSITENQLLDLTSGRGSTEDVIGTLPEVELKLGNGSMLGAKGKIDAISGTIDPRTGAVGIRALFPNPNHMLRNGGTATVIMPHAIKDCYVIPKSATYEVQNKVFVYKVVDGKAASQEVIPFRLNNGTEYIVQSGLSAGDVIVAEGAGLLREGTIITTATSTHQDK